MTGVKRPDPERRYAQRLKDVMRQTKPVLRDYGKGKITRLEADVKLLAIGWGNQHHVDNLLALAKTEASCD